MKKICLSIAALLCLSASMYAQASYELLKNSLENYNQRINTEVQSRDSVPRLYIDTVHCVGYTTFPDYQISDESFEGFTYDSENREIENRRHQFYYQSGFESRTKRKSFYNTEDQKISDFNYDVAPDGTETPTSKTEYEYNSGSNNPSIITTYNWQGSWTPSSRTLLGYDANSNTIEQLGQSYDGLIWVNTFKYVSTFDADNNQTFNQSSVWENNAWVVEYQYNATYDANGNLQEEIYAYGFGGNPLSPYSRNVYYVQTNKVDSMYQYNWNEFSSDWLLAGKEIRIYNASNEWVESYYFIYDGIEFLPDRRSEYEYISNTLNFPSQRTLTQNWDPITGMYLDSYKSEYNIIELPDNKAGGFINAFLQEPPGNGNWLLVFNCDFGFHVDYVTGAQQPAADAPCAMPNPYATGQWISCEDLRDNYNYLAQVFSLDGRRVYARAFKGGEGWSIERALPEGLYVVVLTHNNKVVSKNKVMIR